MKKPTIPTISIISSIEDPRIERRKRHELKNIFFITLCASICGTDSRVSIETFDTRSRCF
ncbi:MAG: transposase family protein [Mariprofundaceae bacterium]